LVFEGGWWLCTRGRHGGETRARRVGKNGAAVAVVVGSEYQVDMARLNISQEVNPKPARPGLLLACLLLIQWAAYIGYFTNFPY
jgi:hypothetical protein